MNRRHLAATGVLTLAAGALVAVGITLSGQAPTEQPDTRPAGRVVDDEPTSTTFHPEQIVPAPADNTPTDQVPEVVVPPADPGDTGDVNQPPPPMPADQAPDTAPNNPAPAELPPALPPDLGEPGPGVQDPGPIQPEDVPPPADPATTDAG